MPALPPAGDVARRSRRPPPPAPPRAWPGRGGARWWRTANRGRRPPASTVSNNSTFSRMWSAPAAARWAAMFGQPSRGLTRRSGASAKLPMARAAMPMFSPSCGSTRITTGPSRDWPALLLSVPDISFRFHAVSQGLGKAAQELIQAASATRPSVRLRLPVLTKFSSEITCCERLWNLCRRPRARAGRRGALPRPGSLWLDRLKVHNPSASARRAAVL